MSNDDTTKELPTGDRLDSLISLVHQIAVDVRTTSERLERLEARQERLEAQITELRTDTEKGFRRLDNKILMYHKTLVELYADHRDLEERVDKLEEKAS